MNTGDDPRPVALRCPQCGGELPYNAEGYAICQYCGSSVVWGRRGAQEVGPPEGAVVRGMRLKPFVYTDADGTGLELFRALMPVGWEFQGGCRWLLDNPGMPAVVAFQMRNPHGAEAFEVLPNMNLTWTDNAMARMMHPTGSRYFGAEVRQPMGIADALRQLVIPRYRGAVGNLRILALDPQPDLPRLVRSEAAVGGGSAKGAASAQGAKVRIQYDGPAGQVEEDIYGVVEIFRVPTASMLGPVELQVWFVDYLFSFRAAAGRLDAMSDLFGAMIGSFRLNPHWYAAFKSIAQYLAQMQIQRIRHIGDIGRIYAQTGREMREQNLRDWYGRQEVYDRLATDWSRTIRGVDGFYDPHREEVVELPSGYGHAWANNLGEYIVTEDSGYNPNIESNLHWEPMEPR